MSRKDYVAVAAIIADIAHTREGAVDAFGRMYHAGHDDARRAIAAELALMFAADNPRFNRARFMTACGFGACES